MADMSVREGRKRKKAKGTGTEAVENLGDSFSESAELKDFSHFASDTHTSE